MSLLTSLKTRLQTKQTDAIQNQSNLHPFAVPTEKWAGLPIFTLFFLTVSLFAAANSQAAQQSAPADFQPRTLNNQLAHHPSPYLAMHAKDPVHWQTWSESILTKAQQLKRPILISSGYFACHWCHVMQQENYQDQQIADLMNRFLVSVKLDRELHSELDHYLIEFARQLTGRAGWPQHVILTADGYPFAAFGYLSKNDFMLTLQRLANVWKAQSQEIGQLARQAAEQAGQQGLYAISWPEFQTQFHKTLQHSMDEFSGGLKGTQKFPESALLLALIQQSALSETEQAWLKLTLDQMQSQHLFDHIHGGFYRYTVDPEWQTPHFEKMAYDNALLARLYLLAYEKWQHRDYLDTALQTLDYLHNHLFDQKTGLYKGSQSALDFEGREGGSYLFNAQQLQQRLSPTAFDLVKEAWHLDHPAPYELGWHPRPTNRLWPQIRRALQHPPKAIPADDKALLGWNGLILSALAEAYRITQQAHYLQQANALAEQLVFWLQQPAPPRAVTSDKHAIGQAGLEDFAYVVQGLQALNRLTQTSEYTNTIAMLTADAQKRFHSVSGWQQSGSFQLPGQDHKFLLPDSALPSAGALIDCSVQPKAELLKFTNQDLQTHSFLDYASYLMLPWCRPDSERSQPNSTIR
ncbi:DUF255 domain-containing protein [Thiomicrorhabdus sp. zzn3]|uniref:thioredoxin domain-containing protein n=1 Tax=Thiomicrorhabdus sp. zzn3 TaxID=3039775 RepID=UPI002436F531|nr:DUF255 domain-containing protein [Thiomicrorhabdus sp. zzn3]MDG6778899.1 DUF255 domain-containing protein [Thiomicrorhabdus sp. zzn3]